MNAELWKKYESLKAHLASFEKVAVAFSGGVDSTFLLFAAKEALGECALAVTVVSEFFPKREMDEAAQYCKRLGTEQIFVRANVLDNEEVAKNPPNRCYLCKKDIFEKIIAAAETKNIRVVADGSNVDDMGDYRPGRQAIEELGIRSPLCDAGFSKSDIRELSKELNIPTWDKPSFACLASRFPYGDRIDSGRLGMVEKAEALLQDMGFRQFRVRIHDRLARIEIEPSEFERFMKENTRIKIYDEFKRIGFEYVSLDIIGY